MTTLTQLTLWEKQTPRAEQVEIRRILANPDALSLQQRVQNDEATIYDYKNAIFDGDILPPIVLFEDDRHQLWVADGIHRLLATKQTGRTAIDALIYSGSRRDALLYAVGANATHGLRRTREDKRKAVQTLLDDPDWSRLSDRQIARLTRTSHPFVAEMRRQQRRAALKALSTHPDGSTPPAPQAPQPSAPASKAQQPDTTATPTADGNVTTPPSPAPEAPPPSTPATGNIASHDTATTTAPPPSPTSPQQAPADYEAALLDKLYEGRGMYFTELLGFIIGDRELDNRQTHQEWNKVNAALENLLKAKKIKQVSGMYYAVPRPPEPLAQIPGTAELWADLKPSPENSEASRKLNAALFNLNEHLLHAYKILRDYQEAPASQELVRETLHRLEDIRALLQQKKEQSLLEILGQGA